jgi:phenylpropionate dioxygenase-like ring-hydroxylating dioxygenase large terminal subunit
MNTTAKPRLSSQLTRWISQAEALGLTVEVRPSDYYSVQRWNVVIRRPQVEAKTALDDYNNLRGVQLVATRVGGGRWLHTAYTTGWSHRQIKKLAVVSYAITGLAE